MPVLNVRVKHEVPVIRRTEVVNGKTVYYDKDNKALPASYVGKMETVTEWVPIYTSSINKRVRTDLNLGDLTNRQEAVKNLGLNGNVTSHYHEEYKRGIQELRDQVDQNDKELRAMVADAKDVFKSSDKEKQYELDLIRQSVRDMLNSETSTLRNILQEETNARLRQDNYIQGLLDREHAERTMSDEEISQTQRNNDADLDRRYETRCSDIEKTVSNLSGALELRTRELMNKMAEFEKDLPNKIQSAASVGVPVGAVLAWPMAKDVPDDFLECNGQAVSAVSYPKLAAMMGNTPDMRNVFLQGSEQPGQNVKAGLPNLQGYFYAFEGTDSTQAQSDGKLFTENTMTHSSNTTIGNEDDRVKRVDFNANKSNSIYGASNTVQPPAYTVKWIIKAK